MVRFFIVFLMLIVVFLAGMVLGVDRGQVAINPDVDDVEQEVKAPEPSDNKHIIENEQIVQVETASSEQMVDAEEPAHLTQKTASFLEAGVKGFYEVVVQMLYQISQLFY